ncbi:hypothetical protein LXA43DRAFT_1187057 [Ganoderma leucocontextum]|nr:hypothetical protein LXA43DRAFT_1187057 [Ganoderma leucocontextum]
MGPLTDETLGVLAIADSDHAIRIASAIAFAILYYDYTLTFGMEVNRFWKGRLSFASFVFYFNRYLVLFGHMPVLYEFYGTTNQKGEMYVPWFPFLSVAMEHQPPVDLSFTWSSVLAYDTTVFALTLYRALGVNSRWRGNILSILLRDGAFYFAVLLVCHLCNILTCILAQAVYRGISVTITNVIASSLITRLMLNLRDPHLLPNRYNDSRASELERSELQWRPRTNTAACSSVSDSDTSTGKIAAATVMMDDGSEGRDRIREWQGTAK